MRSAGVIEYDRFTGGWQWTDATDVSDVYAQSCTAHERNSSAY